MNSTLGHLGAITGLLAAIAGAITVIAGIKLKRPDLVRQSSTYTILLVAGSLLAVFAMERALITSDFSLQYVATNHSTSTPLLFTIASMWAALEGSILLWCAVLAGFIATMVWRFRARRDDEVVAWAMVVAFVVAAFFFGLLAGPADPFDTVKGAVPTDGPGPNPLLQNHPLMAFHPPMLYLGYVGFTVPFAFGIAALITGRIGEGWLIETRRWTLVAWGFLSAGIVLGSWWSYEVLGWGGYWAWDPVENASLLPWLTATAYLHSAMVQERRAMLRVWNLSLLSATFALTILGTFFTRSGVLDSVHAFSESPLGPTLISAFAVIVIVTCVLIYKRASLLGAPGSISSPVSREAAFLANNVAFAAFAFVVLLGTVFPLLVEALQGDRLSVGRPFFDNMTRPIGIVLLFLMGVAPLLPWRGTAAESLAEKLRVPSIAAAAVMVVSIVLGARGFFVVFAIGLGAFVIATAGRQLFKNIRSLGWRGVTGRSSGGMIAHIGVAIIAVAIAVSASAQTRAELTMREGETQRVGGHDITFEGLRAEQFENRNSTIASIRIDGGQAYEPALSLYPNSTDAIGTPSVRTGLREDVYLTLVRTPPRVGEPSIIGVIVNPAVIWLWIGGAVIALGTALAVARRPRVRVHEQSHDLVDA